MKLYLKRTLFIVLLVGSLCNVLQAMETLSIEDEIYRFIRVDHDETSLRNINDIINSKRREITDSEDWERFVRTEIQASFCRCHCLKNEQTREVLNTLQSLALQLSWGQESNFIGIIREAMEKAKRDFNPEPLWP